MSSKDQNIHVPAARVRELCGGISHMTLWRWLDDASLSFPRPIYIARRRYWKEATVVAWLDAFGHAPVLSQNYE